MTNDTMYVPGDSVLHRLDVRIKTGALVWLSIMLTFAGTSGLILASIGLICLMALSNVKFSHYRPIFVVIVWMALFYSIASAWDVDSWRFWEGHFSWQGLTKAGLFIWRISILFILMRVYIAVTPPLEQGLAIAYFFTPCTRIFPLLMDLPLILTLTLRFIPILMEESTFLWKARRVKGSLPRTIIGRFGTILELLIPLLLISFRRAEEVADNLMARGYATGRYRVMFLQKLSRQERLTVLGIIILGAILAWL